MWKGTFYHMATKKPKQQKAKKPKNNNMKSNNMLLYVIIAVIAIAIFVVTAAAASKFFQTETYYVLNQNVPTRTQVTPDMLDPVSTSEGTAPQAAIGIDEVQSGSVYTQFPLVAGDILTASNVGGQTDISVGIPDSWVITNFSVNADDAVGGRIQRGYYFDIMIVGDEGAYYPFVNVLALDTTVDLSNASSSEAADSEEAHDGQTTQYVVGMPPGDAARLQQLMESSDNVKLVLSPRANEYQAPAISEYDGLFTYDQSAGPQNMGNDTDYTFSDVERNEFGEPLEQPNENSCGEGNAKITGEACEGSATDTTTDETATTEETPETTDTVEDETAGN